MRQNMADLDVEGGKEEILPRPLVLDKASGARESQAESGAMSMGSGAFNTSFKDTISKRRQYNVFNLLKL